MHVLILLLLLTGCVNNTLEKLSTIGEPPPLSKIENPTLLSDYQPITMPMPSPVQSIAHKETTNSLWLTGSRAFFKDQRAKKVGDIVTVAITIDQEQSIQMTPKIQRKSSGANIVSNLMGLEFKAEKLFPKKQHGPGVKNSDWINFNGNTQSEATAQYNVNDKMKLKIAATIIQVLPNGNMVVKGRQEIRLVNEVREIELLGVVRPEDISAQNTVKGDKVAEMRISYGGRGDLSEAQSAPWGQQVLNKIMPF